MNMIAHGSEINGQSVVVVESEKFENDLIKEIKELLQYFNGFVYFRTPVIVKMSPHSNPTKIYSISSIDEIKTYSLPVQQTIAQRLRYTKANSIKKDNMKEHLKAIIDSIQFLPLDEKVEAINEIRKAIHEVSPFKTEPVDCVLWVKNDKVVANDYNPNKVAPPEMELLEISIMNDGYTQPIVTWPHDDKVEVIDGFHRNRVGKESKIIKQRIKGYLPTVEIKKEQSGKNDRIASTIRHNRARGKHMVDAMSEIVIELKNRNWSNERISRELGMDEEEVLRLCQISGLENLFTDADFSKAWESSDVMENGYEAITDDVEEDLMLAYKIPNESDPDRIFHTFDKWECHKAGFYSSKKEGMTTEQCEIAYAEFLKKNDAFKEALSGVISEWKHSCEHYLTNKSMNRIAWLGQAAMCYATGIPSRFCSGFNRLSDDEQKQANEIALQALNQWLTNNNRQTVTMEDALSIGRQTELY